MTLQEFCRTLGLRLEFGEICDLPPPPEEPVLRVTWRGKAAVVVRVAGGYALRAAERKVPN